MTYQIRFETAAREELATAIQWYEEQRLGLGRELLDSVDEATERLVNNPGISTSVPGCPPDLPVRRIFVREASSSGQASES